MAFSIYESISNNQTIPVNVFVVSIQGSTFHWHNEYELVGVLKGSIVLKAGSEEINLKCGGAIGCDSMRFFILKDCS